MLSIVFATGNNHKAREAEAALGGAFRIISLKEAGCEEELQETQATLEGNALQKARYVHQHYQVHCFAEDTGLEVDALGGAPGVFSARYAGPEKDTESNVTLLLRNLEGQENRKARFRTVIALILDDREYLFEGVAEGHIALRRSGNQGFGYDPVFVPEGGSRTFAEMSLAEKNSISHRARALSKLQAFLQEKTGAPGTP